MSLQLTEPDAWSPTVVGGRRLRWLRTAMLALVSVVALGAVALASTGFLLYRQAEANLTRVPLSELAEREPEEAQHFLIVGSDSRADLTREERNDLTLGHDFSGQRSDTIILVSVLPERAGVNVVSFPRDLYVEDGGQVLKLNQAFNRGPDNLIRVLRENFGIPVNHYLQVSVQGFVEVVRTIGEVEICLDEPLTDAKSGADFEAGCHQMTPQEALAYVRSRVGSDFRRIERQQTFMRSMLGEMTDARLLTDLPRLLAVVEDVADDIATDPGLGLGEMRTLAEELRGLARGDIPMTFVPGYTRDIDTSIGTQNFVIAYEPGARALIEDIREDNPLVSRGRPEQRAETPLAVWSHGRWPAAEVLVATLGYAGYDDITPAGEGPDEADPGARTVVYEVPGHERAAGWVAATLGADVEPLPADVDAPRDIEVVVSAGDDATPPA